MKVLKTIFFSVMSIISAGLSYIGFSGLCCTIVGGMILSAIGLISLSSFLYYHKNILIAFSVIFAILAVFSFKQRDPDRKCPYCKTEKFNNKKYVKKNKIKN